MLYILSSLVAATLFGLGTVAVYGQGELLGNAWTDYVFWWLIGTGVVLQMLDGHLHLDLRCLWDRLTSMDVQSPCGALSH